jgi:mono/diheme cytochrome c family protein
MIRSLVGAAVVGGAVALAAAASPLVLSAARQDSGHRAQPRNATVSSAAAPAAGRVDAASAGTVLNRYCVTCHNERLKTGGFVLNSADTAAIAQHPDVWEKVVQKLRAGVMPPAGLPRPDTGTYEALASWFESELDRAAAAHPSPGRSPAFHRLNRAEYRNAVRDLLGLDIDVSAHLPPDDASYGFDNIGDILGISPTLLEGYLEAARRISQEAIGDPRLRAETYTYRAAPDLTQDYRLEGLPFGTRGGLLVEHNFPLDGEYEIKAQLLRSFIGGIMGLAEKHELEFSLDGRRLQLFSIGGKKKAPAGEGQEEAQAEKPKQSEKPADADLLIKVPIKAGHHALTVAFLERPAVQGEDFRPPYLRSYAVLSDFNNGQPHVASVAITGPFNGRAGESSTRQRILACRPEQASKERACARTILTGLAHLAYRRPVTDDDLQPLLTFFEAGRSSSGSFDGGIQRALQRLLISPEFLVRVERDPSKIAPDTNYRVSDLELASRLSFFLWSSIPDQALLDAAERGQLKDPAVLEQQVRRMLADDRSAALVNNFAGQWLYLRNVPASRPDTQLFPDFDDNLRQAMRRETELLFDHVIRSDRSALELISARYTFVNERLARHYGMPNIYGSQFRRVELGASDPRGGLIGQASILTVTAYPNRTSPVLRGKWILENILNAPPPPPPPNVPDLQEKNAAGKVLSMRDRMVQHRSNPVCASCHSRMDPLGLALEPFDAVGRWRDLSESHDRIDASGVLPDGTPFNGPTELRMALLKDPRRFASTLTEKLLTYALGRGLSYEDAPAVRAIVHDSAAHEYRLSELVSGIVRSTPFQMRRSRS